METLEEIRVYQAEADLRFNPVVDMYQLLDKHLPDGVTDKDEMDNRSMMHNNWEALIVLAKDR